MNESVRPNPATPTAQEIEAVFQDLANVFIRYGNQVAGQQSCDANTIIAELRKRDHSEPAIRTAIASGCQRSTTGDRVLASIDDLASWRSIAISLSGGGLRATLFQLGIFLYLANARELGNVRAIVSISGGSILAAHLSMNWKRVIGRPEDFGRVATELITFVRGNIRNAALIRWLWSRLLLLIWFKPSWSRFAFLEGRYKKHFGELTLGDISSDNGVPTFAFVATDTIAHRRVALSPDGIFSFEYDGCLADGPTLAKGVHLSMAVALSSCFPPVFNTPRLTHRELGITFDEFKGSLSPNDGGVAGNLGIEVFNNLREQKVIEAMRFVFCDAENSLAEEPANTPMASAHAQGAALSEAGRRLIKELGPRAHLLPFANRPPTPPGLPVRVKTNLAPYRTDLDQPTWPECLALMTHGAAVCDQVMHSKVTKRPTPQQMQDAIRQVLEDADCPRDLPGPNEAALKRCGYRSYWLIAFNILLFLIVCAAISDGIGWLNPRWQFRPLRYLWQSVVRERITNRTLNDIATEVSTAVCNNTIRKIEKKLLDDSLTRVIVIVGDNPTSSFFHVYETMRPPMCDHNIDCEFVFRGNYQQGNLHAGDTVSVTGRMSRIYPDKFGLKAYIEFEGCSAVTVPAGGFPLQPSIDKN